jgi:hypothetical protein
MCTYSFCSKFSSLLRRDESGSSSFLDLESMVEDEEDREAAAVAEEEEDEGDAADAAEGNEEVDLRCRRRVALTGSPLDVLL